MSSTICRRYLVEYDQTYEEASETENSEYSYVGILTCRRSVAPFHRCLFEGIMLNLVGGVHIVIPFSSNFVVIFWCRMPMKRRGCVVVVQETRCSAS
jgi:hypothetical protein